MTGTLIYSLLAILILVLAAVLSRRREISVASDEFDQENFQGLWEEPALDLAERIFDSSDYVWLRDRVGFPRLARALARSRQQLALRWLKALRQAFDELVRTPELEPAGNVSGAPESRRLLWLTLRFHLLLSYAVLVVWLLGPYHRLVPSFGWMHVFSEPAHQKERCGAADISNFS